MNITITIQDAEVQAMLKRLLEKTGNLKPALREIGMRYERNPVCKSLKSGSRIEPFRDDKLLSEPYWN